MLGREYTPFSKRPTLSAITCRSANSWVYVQDADRIVYADTNDSETGREDSPCDPLPKQGIAINVPCTVC